MKIHLLSFLLATSALAVFAADEPSLSGVWQVHRSAAGTESKQVCTISQKETGLAGSCSSDQGQLEINGKVEGKKVTWGR